ncbi:MAG: hypothetical protein HQL12_03485 [Candidatus Omnitrophica bacterium]|nr:hypothetical protein [Candidatus Omnitrophota bacterium]
MKKAFCILTLLCFLVTSILGPSPVFAQSALPAGSDIRLPAPGQRVHLSQPFNPPILKGIKIHPNNPFRFDFILDKGDLETPLMASLQNESTKLIKYFLASLTIPEKDLWVNLSPYEKDSIVPQSFGQTEMGRDLLAEDYILKQITASLIYPEDEVGKKFWKRVYEEAAKRFGSTNIPVNTFNKVWIVPAKAVVYENVEAKTAYVVESKLKVMLEQDYLALSKNQMQTSGRQPGDMFNIEQQKNVSPSTLPNELGLNVKAPPGQHSNDLQGVNELGSKIVREIVIPELTKEVNEDKNFSQLRQVYNSLILATWYKKKIKDSILAQVYIDKKKVLGAGYELSIIPELPTRGRVPAFGDVSPSCTPSSKGLNVKATQRNKPNDVELIYQRYLQAFKKGVYNYIKEEIDPATDETIPRKYFSGGFDATDFAQLTLETVNTIDYAQLGDLTHMVKISAGINVVDKAMISNEQMNAKLIDAYQGPSDEEMVDLTPWFGESALKEGFLKNSFILPNGKTWGRQVYMRVGGGLRKVEVIVHKKNREVTGITLVGYKGDEVSSQSQWIWDGEKFNYKVPEDKIIQQQIENKVTQELMDAYNNGPDGVEVKLTEWIGEVPLRKGYMKASFILPNGEFLGRNMGLGLMNLTQVKAVIHKKGGKVEGITLVGYREEKEVVRNKWEWDGNNLNYPKQQIEDKVKRELVNAYESGPDGTLVDITDFIGKSSLDFGLMKSSFILPDGDTWGRQESMRVKTKLTKVKVVIHKKKGEVSGTTFIGYKGDKEAGRSEWQWDGKKFIYQENKVKQELINAYENGQDETTVDITDLLGERKLKDGVLGMSFILPSGKTWGIEEAMKVGVNLTSSKVVIHKKEGKIVGITLIGYRGEKEWGRSEWTWDGKKFSSYSQTKQRQVGDKEMEEVVNAYRDGPDGKIIDLTDWLKGSSLESGTMRGAFILPNGDIWHGYEYMKVGINLTQAKIVVHKNEQNVTGITFIGYRGDKEIGRSEWVWHENKFNYHAPADKARQQEAGDRVRQELISAYQNGPDGTTIDLTDWLGKAYLKNALLRNTFILPDGNTMGKSGNETRTKIGAVNLTRMKVIIHKKADNVEGLTFVGYRGDNGIEKEVGRSEWQWVGGNLNYQASEDKMKQQQIGDNVKQRLMRAYREGPDGKEVDLTDWLQEENLKRGVIKNTFILPNGANWRNRENNYMKVGINLTQASVVIHKNDNKVESISFVGYKDGQESGRSQWLWDGTEFIYQNNVLKNHPDVQEAIASITKNLDEIFLNNLGELTGRYVVDIKNLLWGLAGHQLKGKYDEETIRKLIDNQLRELFEEEEGLQSIDTVDIKEQGKEESPGFLEEPNLTQEEISAFGRAVEEHLKNLEQDEGLRNIVRDQAKNFIRKLEEKYFFRQYYRDFPQDLLGQEVSVMLDLAIEEEKGSITKEVLGDILQEVKEALAYQEKLVKLGVKTPMNLYQLLTMKKVLDLKGIVLADEMGLGKTLQALASFLLSGKEEMLVLGPKSVLSRWMDDMGKHLDTPLELVILGEFDPLLILSENPKIKITVVRKEDRFNYILNPRPPATEGHKRVVLMNYELLPNMQNYRHKNQLPAIHTDFLALDEAHLLKNRYTDTSKAVYGDSQGQGYIEAEYKMVMTGTPLENRPQDMYAPLQYLARGGTSDEEKFFAGLTARQFAANFAKERLDRLSMLHSYISSRMVRRYKEDVLTGLPQKEEKIVKLDPLRRVMKIGDREIPLAGNYQQQMSLYEKAYSAPGYFDRKYIQFDDEEDISETPESEVTEEKSSRSRHGIQLIRMEQAALSPDFFEEGADSIKFDAAKMLVKERVAQGKSVIIFSNYRQPLGKLRSEISQMIGEDQVAYVDGTVVDNDRQKQIDLFQAGQAKVMVATIATLGLGIELTQADSIIFLNYPWKPSTFKQAIDRAHRRDDQRNMPGKKLEIISLEYDAPMSIDHEKAKVLKRKNILAEMIIEGNLTPEVLRAFRDVDKRLVDSLKKSSDSMVLMDPFELSLLQEVRLIIGQIAHTNDMEKRRQLWDKTAQLYTITLEHSASFYANLAGLDYLSSDAFPELKGYEIKALDLASGPSTLYRAYERGGAHLRQNGLNLDITDYDANVMMLRLGQYREGQQMAGHMDDLGKAMDEGKLKEGQYGLVNMSYALKYTDHPAALMKNIHRLLKEGGVFSLILPDTHIIPPSFIEAMQALGFELKPGAKLISSLDDETYKSLVEEYGEGFAQDVRTQTQGSFTYLVARKAAETELAGVVTDKDFLMSRKVPIEWGRDKVEKMLGYESKMKIIPETVMVRGDVVFTEDLLTDLLMPPAEETDLMKINKILRQPLRLISQLSIYSHQWAENRSSRLKQELLNEKLIALSGDLTDWISEHGRDLDRDQKEQLRLRIESLTSVDRVRQWFIRHLEIIQELRSALDAAMSTSLVNTQADKGGIDLTSDKVFSIQNNGQGIKFQIDPVMLRQLQNASGFVPVIIDIQPMTDLRKFLGLQENAASTPSIAT